MESADPPKVAIVDLGSARTKITVAAKSCGVVKMQTTAIEIGLSVKALMARNAEPAQAIAELNASINKALNGSTDKVAYVGTHAFRSGELADELLKNAGIAFPNFTVLSPKQEAGIFYLSAGLEEEVSDYAAVDVGGGSVQVIWGPSEGDSAFGDVGTFTLEKKFQADTSTAVGPGDDEWMDMRNAVIDAFMEKVVGIEKPKQLIVGSNLMKDFFSSAASAASLHEPERGTLHQQSVCQLMRLIRGKPYSESYFLFQAKPGFIHGADKLFAVVSALMQILDFQVVRGTNASTSKGLCRLLIEEPDELKRYGIVVE